MRIRTLKGALSQRRLLLMEGGQWIWPPVEVGHAAPTTFMLATDHAAMVLRRMRNLVRKGDLEGSITVVDHRPITAAVLEKKVITSWSGEDTLVKG